MLKQILSFLFSAILILANPPQTCTLDLMPNTAELLCEDEALNRLLEYDQGENAKGKLTKITDSLTHTRAYDTNGNMANLLKNIHDKSVSHFTHTSLMDLCTLCLCQ